MKILNRFTGELIFECKNQTAKTTVEKAIKKNIKLSRANLWGADLRDANLSRANLWGADLRDANLSRANLWGADLRDANLSCVNLIGADLTDADLRYADLTDADLTGANLTGAKLRGAYLWGEKISKNPLCINSGFKYQVWITDHKIKIGCQLHATAAWENFTDAQIKKMDGDDALEFWAVWKELILTMAKWYQRKEG